ncbi:MAG: extracellular solute-binding protein [Eubacteriales bacterium]|nr:extracellular solute-binding protein [Eubacteriales bacterium]
MKKILAIALALCMVLSLGVMACAEPAKELTLWTYPIGAWGNAETVEALMADFEAATGIKVSVEYLDYTNGDDQVNTALEGGAAPDLIMEGPERLVANWGVKGYMVDLADLWDDGDKAEVNAACQSACFTADGKCYEYPVVMTAHCMAINYDAFKEAGADQYVDIENHTWTTENFIKACDALYAKYGEAVGDVFCAGQGGDQGTRALINNLYGGTFTNAEHTAYTADSAENVKALELLQSLDAIYFNAAEVGNDEIIAFRQGLLKMAFCWNIAQQLNSDNNDAGLTNDGEEIVFMSFPSETGESKLCGGIWGFGIFDNGDEAKVEAAKEFIKYFCDGKGTAPAIKAASYFAVRDIAGGEDISGIWADNEVMNEYKVLMPYLGDYYQVTSGWATARTEWWNMLQRIGDGGVVADEVATFCANANAAAEG